MPAGMAALNRAKTPRFEPRRTRCRFGVPAAVFTAAPAIIKPPDSASRRVISTFPFRPFCWLYLFFAGPAARPPALERICTSRAPRASRRRHKDNTPDLPAAEDPQPGARGNGLEILGRYFQGAIQSRVKCLLHQRSSPDPGPPPRHHRCPSGAYDLRQALETIISAS